LVAAALSAAAAGPASAAHSWGSYHWAEANSSSPAVSVDLGDNLTKSRSTDWPAIFKGASPTGANVVSNWSRLDLFPLGTGNVFADILETPAVTGANLTSQKRCKPKSGRVEVCNARYGYNGWLGVAQIWTSGGHIVQGTAKANDSYLDSSTYTPVSKQHVLCQEVGHTFGLGHTSEDGRDDNTCMDYADAFDNPHTNAHDNEQTNAIYTAHDDPGTTTTSTATQGKGKVRRLGKDVYVETFPNGEKIFTFVTFTNDAAAARAPKDRVPG
jgi:hypothetical protein